MTLEPSQNKMVDLIPWPRLFLDAGQVWTLGRNEGPMFLPRRARSDPILEQCDLGFGQHPAGIGGWHSQVGIIGSDAAQQFAVVRLTWNDRPAAVQIGEYRVAEIESQWGNSLVLIRAMTGETCVGQDRAYVAVEVQLSDSTLSARDRRPATDGGDRGESE